ncbi:MAG: cytochrome c-type biogenesis protein CcmH [Xanthomonadales bacterium]|nr:cytochrome c-type biogenesis protein CcmH [Gammaproteobacteria bacterium]NNE05775.1 cytochrome c-type biogenesis protein CcmH [Xanthomonadales bacterium]NNL96294.1 cytochrome c-type biogenesis protein CcmH [Xanthomonadales bacterium]
MKKLLVWLLFCCLSSTVFGQVQGSKEPLVFASPEQQARFNRLTTELRCLVCQNQNLADSDAPLAHDLRKELYDMMQSGLSDDQIKQFLVERYGDFVLYRPPVKGNTLLLWLAPALLLVGGALVVWFNVRQRKRLLIEARSDEEA